MGKLITALAVIALALMAVVVYQQQSEDSVSWIEHQPYSDELGITPREPRELEPVETEGP